MARRRTLPPVSPKISTELRPLVAAISEIIETGEGVRGDPLDRKLTLRDLIDSGIGKLRAGAAAGNPNALQPNPAPPNLATPPAPTGFNATGAFDGRINLTWDIPGTLYSNHAYTNVYRAEADNFANAVLVGREAGSFYTDDVRSDVTIKPYYYWITFTSTSDIEGPLNATAGTMAQALFDPNYIIGQIEGLISESELANELLTPIQAIPGIQTTLSDHGGRISSTEAALSDLLNISVYDTATDYAADDLVSYNDRAWRALVAMTAPAPTPTEGANWTEVGNYATFSDLIGANAVAIDDLDARVTANDGDITANATDITALGVRVTDTESDTTANASAIGTLDSRVTVAEGSITTNSSDITLLQSDLTTAQGDISGNSTALNLLDSRVTTAEGTISANASDITQLQADVQALDVDGNAQALQDLDVRVTANETDITAIASDVTTLTASVDGNTSAIQTKAEVSAVQAVEGDITVLSAEYTVKLDVNGYVSGIGLANNGGASEFVVASDAVYFIDPATSIEAFNPAANYASIDDVRDTQLVFGYAEVEGHKRFVINVPAYIPEGYITSGQVGAIGFGKITDSLGNPVTTVGGKLKADYIDVDNLSVAEAATFFGDAQSGNYSAGTAGWRILQSGSVEFQNGTFRGRIEATSGFISDTLQIGGTSQDIGEVAQLANDGTRVLFTKTFNQYFPGNSTSDTFSSGGSGKVTIEVQSDLSYSAPSAVTLNAVTATKVASRDTAARRIEYYEAENLVVGTNTVRVTAPSSGSYLFELAVIKDAVGIVGKANTAAGWVKPGSTLIDGNKIFTGDAYVDTLQIQGNAVTVPASAVRTSDQFIYSYWQTACSTSYSHGFGQSIPGIIQITAECSSDIASTDGAYAENSNTIQLRILISGSQAVLATFTVIGPTPVSAVRFAEVTLPSGSYTISLQQRRIGGNGSPDLYSASFVVLGAKR